MRAQNDGIAAAHEGWNLGPRKGSATCSEGPRLFFAHMGRAAESTEQVRYAGFADSPELVPMFWIGKGGIQ